MSLSCISLLSEHVWVCKCSVAHFFGDKRLLSAAIIPARAEAQPG
jgi:hypothetical protein